MAKTPPTVPVQGQFMRGDFIMEVVEELRQLAVMSQAGLAEPTPCQKLAFHMLNDVIDINTYPENHK